MEDLTGRTINSVFFKRKIGEGAFGAVYLGEEAIGDSGERDVAIKVAKPHYDSTNANYAHLSNEYLHRFEREARIIAQLRHPHILPLFSYWSSHEGEFANLAFMVMPYMEGGTLEGALEAGPVSNEQIFAWIEQITSGLSYAHGKHLVHRDIKPSNMLLDEKGNIYIGDFGIAQVLIGPDRTGSPSGTYKYMSPEQFEPEVTPAADVYSLGMMTFEMLTGKYPFTSVIAHLTEPLPPISAFLPHINPALDAVLLQATDKKPENRYPNVTAFASALRAALFQTQKAYGAGGTTQIIDEPLMAPNPYNGLQAFKEEDAERFYGRAELIERLLTRLAQAGEIGRFIAVVGPSGSGKSSVIRAGLIPALRHGAIGQSDYWKIVTMTPNEHPLMELEAALLRAYPHVPSLKEQLEGQNGLERALKRLIPSDETVEQVIFIDQLEELFTLTKSAAERDHFLDILMSAITAQTCRLRVIIALRGDFYDRPLDYREFGELMHKYTEVVLPLKQEELRDAITSPAESVNAQFEPGLVETIIAEVETEPGSLPLLQYMLTELYDRDSQQGRWLRRSTYDAIGGVAGALGKTADDLYDMLDSGEQEAARQIFLRLVTLVDGTNDTRRRAQLSEVLGAAPQAQRVIDLYNHTRLLTLDRNASTHEATVEVAHEALIRNWTRLRDWLDESREELLIQRRLTQETQEWLAAGRSNGFLAGEGRLAQFEEFQRRTSLRLTPDEVTFIHTSIDRRHAIEAQVSRRRRGILAGVSTALVIVTSLLLLSVKLSHDVEVSLGVAQENERIAFDLANTNATQVAITERERDEALSGRLSMSAIELAELGNRMLGIPMSLMAYFLNPAEPLAQKAMFQQIDDEAIRYTLPSEFPVFSGVFDPDGKKAYGIEAGNLLHTWDIVSGQTTTAWREPIHIPIAYDFDLSADESTLLVGYTDGSVILHDVTSGRIIRRFEALPFIVWDVEWSPNEEQILALTPGDGATIRPKIVIYEAVSGNVVSVFEQHEGTVLNAKFTPDGEHVFSVGGAYDVPTSQIFEWEVATGRLIRQLDPNAEVHAGRIMSLDLSGDGRLMATSSRDDARLAIWDVSGNQAEIVCQFDDLTFESRPLAIKLSPDNSHLAAGSLNGSVHVWNIANCTLEYSYAENTFPISEIAFSPTGQTIAVIADSDDPNDSVFGDSPVLLNWDITANQVTAFNLPHMLKIEYAGALLGEGLAFSQDGQQVFVAFSSGVYGFNVQTGTISSWQAGLFRGAGLAALSPDGSIALEGSVNGSVAFWDVRSGELIRTYAHLDTISAVQFNAAGTLALTASSDGMVIVWDTQTFDPLYTFKVGEGDVLAYAAFMPDDIMILSASVYPSDNISRIMLWDAQTGAELKHLSFDDDVASLPIALSPKGDYIIYEDVSTTATKFVLLDTEQFEEADHYNFDSSIQAISFSPDGDLLAVGGINGELELIDRMTKERRQLVGHTSGINFINFSPDAKQLLVSSGSVTGSVQTYLWDIGSDLQSITLPSETIFSGYATSQPFSADGSHFYAYKFDEPDSVVEFDTATFNEARRFEIPEELDGSLVLVTSPDGRWLAGADGTNVILWDLPTGEPHVCPDRVFERTFQAAITFSPDSSRIVTNSPNDEYGLIAWNPESCEILQKYIDPADATLPAMFNEPGMREAWGIVYAPDGQTIYSGGARAANRMIDPSDVDDVLSNQLIQWDATTGEIIRRFPVANTGGTMALDVSGDGTKLAVAQWAFGITIWDTQTGTEIGHIGDQSVNISDVDLSADGQLLMSLRDSGEVTLWDVPTAQELRRFVPSGDNGYSVNFTPDNRAAIFTVEEGDTVVVYHWLTAADAIRDWLIVNRFVRCFTDAERSQYGIEPTCPPGATETQ